MKILLALVAIAIVPVGCTLLDTVSDRVAGAVSRYCEEPAEIRFTVRNEINTRLESEGHTIIVTCGGD